MCRSVSLTFFGGKTLQGFFGLSHALYQTIGSDVCGMDTFGLRLILIMMIMTMIMMRVKMTIMETITNKRGPKQRRQKRRRFI